MIQITKNLKLKTSDIQFTYIRSSGPGGQNVNKVSTAVQLRFNLLRCSSLTATVRDRLIAKLKNKLTLEGDIIIKSSSYRSQVKNKEDALKRLQTMLIKALAIPKKRKKTKPSAVSIQRRLTQKKRRGTKKSLRQYNSKNMD